MIDARKYGPPTVGPVRLAWRRLRFATSIAWRPVHGDPGQSWLGAWRKYRLGLGQAWAVACELETQWGPTRWNG